MQDIKELDRLKEVKTSLMDALENTEWLIKQKEIYIASKAKNINEIESQEEINIPNTDTIEPEIASRIITKIIVHEQPSKDEDKLIAKNMTTFMKQTKVLSVGFQDDEIEHVSAWLEEAALRGSRND